MIQEDDVTSSLMYEPVAEERYSKSKIADHGCNISIERLRK